MPSTTGRMRMPHNNRMHSSLTLKMTGMWKNTIGYDPYAASDEGVQDSELAQDQAKGLMALAKLSNQNTQSRGACKKCGMIGHLTYQCRNHLLDQPKAVSESSDDSDSESEESSSRSPSIESSRHAKGKRKRSSHHKKNTLKTKEIRSFKASKDRRRIDRRHTDSDSDTAGASSHRKRRRRDSDDISRKKQSKQRKSSNTKKRKHRHQSRDI
ncbi:unnamed protein product [Albugo candida]|uniref:CCHC-type domain-containing protein n=5 Tax=Albugo candida TaxID=65357 RepID=A0A024G937_9STRA|nr:unnamed protein product [Albugo candida]|eukprot:CCI43189.1 unnamed protein product [Albugo candida]